MYNRKKRLFLTAVCLSLGLLTGCNVGDTKNYKQAAQDLEQGNYEAALEEYETAISEGVKPAQSYRGAGVAKLKLGNYEEAITYFNDALKCDKVGKALKKDILSYRAVAYLKVKDYEAALEDCQTLAENYKMDADLYLREKQHWPWIPMRKLLLILNRPTAKMQLMTELSRSTGHI